MKVFKKSIYFVLIALFVIALIPLNQTANAIESGQCDTGFYSNNDILYYNPCSSSCGSGAGNGSVSTISSLRGDNNGDKIFNFWVDAGLSPQQAAGITGSMQHEGGFSPFRQEEGKGWPSGGWGIAQFTGGQRDAATAAVKDAVGNDTFNQYYSNSYGGGVTQSTGFIPSGVSKEVNDGFLLAELNYLLQYIQSFKPSSISDRVDGLKADYGQTVDASMTLYAYLKTLTDASSTAEAWTYLYEYPGDIKSTAAVRAASAEHILSMNASGETTGCGGDLAAGGMTLSQAQEFMKNYSSNPDNAQYIGGAGQDCNGGPLSNCVSFSAYFINKYTTIQGFGKGTSPGNGSTVVANIVARNPTIQVGHAPRPYAIFSTPSGSQMCGSVKCGHTGVILGVDTVNNKVIVGEAACGAAADWDGAHEYDISQFTSDNYTYAYTDGLLKGSVQ